MLDKLAGIEARYEQLNRLMAEGDSDYNKLTEYAKERAALDDIVSAGQTYRAVMKDLEGARALLGDPAMAELAAQEVTSLEAQQARLEERLRELLAPKDPRDERNVIVEIRAGAGGDEAGIFAADLFRMYTRYAEGRNWKVDLMSANETGVGGFKEVVFQIKGPAPTRA